MRVIVDLVLNHTSDQHPWFQTALEDPSSRYRDFYVWSDEPRDDLFDKVIFPGEETSNWEYHEASDQYYLHRFFAHQPDLDVANPEVRDAFAEIVGFWLQLGVDGFRVDAVPYLIETDGLDMKGEDDEWHGLLRDLHRFMQRRNGGTALLGEVNLPVDEAVDYFGDRGDELNLIFSFDVNQAMWLSLARQDAAALREALASLPELDDEVHWANFARLHDEANVGRLTEDERAEVFAAFAPDPDMQVFDRGMRRRLAPMLGGDPARLRMVHSILLTLPGTPVLYYGEEIGMGENLELEGRIATRSTMQWNDGPTGGFGPPGGEPARRKHPDGPYGPDQVNVTEQRTDPDSLLTWVARAVHARRQVPELKVGTLSLPPCDDDAVLVHRCDLHDSAFVAVHNLSSERREAHVTLDDAAALRTVLSSHHVELDRSGSGLTLTLPPYAHLWLQTGDPLHHHAPRRATG